MSARGGPLIRLESVSKVYRTEAGELRAVDGISLEIGAGDFVAITGASGSGKSTLLQILGLLDSPSSGRYLLEGADVSHLGDDELARLRGSRIGFVFQFFNLLGRSSALDNVQLPLVYAGQRDRARRAAEALEAVGLADRASHTPRQLSGGQQQRVAIARAVVGGPALLLADEPTGNISSEQAREVMDQLRRMNERGITVVLITHDPAVAAAARRRIVMRDGAVVLDERSGGAAPAASSPPALEGEPAGSAAARVFENMAMAMDAIMAHKLRTGLAALGIVIGVGALVSMMVLGAGARRAMRERISAMGVNMLYVYPDVGSRRILERSREGITRLTVGDVKAIAALRNAGVPILAAAPNVGSPVKAVHGDRNWDTRIIGAWPEYASMHGAFPAAGRFFTMAENDARARVAVIGPTVAASLFGEGVDPTGQTIKIQKDYFQVVGVMRARGGSRYQDQDNEIVIPAETAMRRVLGVDYVQSIEVEMASPEASAGVQKEILELVRRRHNLPPSREDDIRVFDMAEVQATLSATTKTVTLLLGSIAAIALLVGGIGIMNIMLVSVKERTREIGLRKAMGARSRDILLQFLIESAAISAAGGAAGILFGLGLGALAARAAGWPWEVWPSSAAVAFGFSALTGIVFGLWPAAQAAAQTPAEALRYE